MTIVDVQGLCCDASCCSMRQHPLKAANVMRLLIISAVSLCTSATVQKSHRESWFFCLLDLMRGHQKVRASLFKRKLH